MKTGNKYVLLILLTLVILGFGTADAQQNIAQQAYAIFERNCLNCHGEHGAYTEEIILEHTALIETGAIVPGKPVASELYRRLLENNSAKRMPLGQPRLSDRAILTIRNWIQAGAPDWGGTSETDGPFITPKEMLETIERHVNSLSPFDRAFTRYFTLTHLYNAGETPEALHAYQRALSKLVNGLSWGREVINPRPIDSEEMIFYIDLRNYEWEIGTNRWMLIEAGYPYKVEFDASTQASLHEKLMNLREEMDCEVPFVHADWFLATASLPPLYNDILDLPETDQELEARLEVNVAENLRNAAGIRVWRAGFSDSGVSNNNRVVERHISRYGAYWKSYDFAGSVGRQNIFTFPTSFRHDGGEAIFNLPNGLQAYYLSDADGKRLDAAPIKIVRNPAASDPTVRNGLSCIGCHTEGMKTFKDQVRTTIEQTPDPLYDKAQALRLYAEQTTMDAFLAADTRRYRQALETAGGVFGGIEPISRFYEAFHAPIDTAHAAASLGLETEVFLQKIRENDNLRNLGLAVLENGTMKRDTWTSNFSAVVFSLNRPSIVEEIFPETAIAPVPGDIVNMPDPNLRAIILTMFGKAPNASITPEDMQTITHLRIEDAGVSDLMGLEFATNLSELIAVHNKIHDLSPLAGLIKLKHLNVANHEIGHNSVSDLSPLTGLESLESLWVRNNPISDLSPLAGLKKLKELEISETLVDQEDLSVLVELPNLESYTSWGVPITDISLFTKLPKLKLLDICGGNLPDLSPLADATNLEQLYLVGNNISDITPLSNLTNLKRLDLQRNNISDISPLIGLTNLKWLSLFMNPIPDFSLLDELMENTNIVPTGFFFSADNTYFGADDMYFEVGDTFTLHIEALFVRELSGWQCNLNFNAHILEAIKVEEGAFLKQDGTGIFFQEGTIDNTNGIIRGFNALRLDGRGVSGSGTLLSVTFRAKNIGEAEFLQNNCQLGSNTGESIDSSDPDLELVIRIVEELPEEVIAEDEFSGPAWDVNKDGQINILDMIIISNNFGKSLLDADVNPRTDVNGDGTINIMDLILVANNLGQ